MFLKSFCEDFPAFFKALLSLPVMDNSRGEVGDSRMEMLPIIPSKEALAERSGVHYGTESIRELRSVF